MKLILHYVLTFEEYKTDKDVVKYLSLIGPIFTSRKQHYIIVIY